MPTVEELKQQKKEAIDAKAQEMRDFVEKAGKGLSEIKELPKLMEGLAMFCMNIHKMQQDLFMLASTPIYSPGGIINPNTGVAIVHEEGPEIVVEVKRQPGPNFGDGAGFEDGPICGMRDD